MTFWKTVQAAVAALCLVSSAAEAGCRQALALALDVSGSVDVREYRLQLDGLAQALQDPRVKNALLVLPQSPVEILVFEWSGPDDQNLLVPWTPVTSEAALLGIVALLENTERRPATPGTALGTAMDRGATYLKTRSHCARMTLDVSGDGKSNLGPRPREIKDKLARSGVTINGLVVGSGVHAGAALRDEEIAGLSAYFRANVIIGEDAFVQTALSYADYADAMARKLIREVETLVFSKSEHSVRLFHQNGRRQ